MGGWRKVWLHLRGQKGKENEKAPEQLSGARQEIEKGVPRDFARLAPEQERIVEQGAERDQSAARVDIRQMIRHITVPDQTLAGTILSNIFLLPKDRKEKEDSWPAYEAELYRLLDACPEILKREYKQALEEYKYKGKKKKKETLLATYQLKRDATKRYIEQYVLTLGKNIQDIDVELRKIEDERRKRKLELDNLVYTKQPEIDRQYRQAVKAYHDLIESNVSVLDKLKNALEGVLTLKKAWKAVAFCATYVIAAISAKGAVTSEQFKQFILDKLSKMPYLDKFQEAGLVTAQWVAAVLATLASAGLATKLVENLLKRRAARKAIKEFEEKKKAVEEEIAKAKKDIEAMRVEKEQCAKKMIENAIEDVAELNKNYLNEISSADAALIREAIIDRAIGREIGSILRQNPRALNFAMDNPNIINAIVNGVMRQTEGMIDPARIRERVILRLRQARQRKQE